ncbi:hypothetical protein BT93_E2252 [Corymbia citriodora subsp. variegata]|nr:hypothetical protein BT93_E2252 [Corymbia citriodora subsp. variegata]
MRFKCVSKLWRCTIEDPNFATMHLKQSAQSGTNCYVLLTDWNFSRNQRSFLYPQKSLTSASQLEIEVPFISPIGYWCRGFHKVIPTLLPDYLFVDMYAAHMLFGFGYSDTIDDYEVVRIIYFPDKYERYLGEIDPKVDVYSLGTNLWRTVEFNFRCELSHFARVYFNENLHWLSMAIDEDRHYVPDYWTKLHTLDLDEGVSRFHGFMRSGELLLQTYQHELISWDPSMGLTRLLWKLGRFDLVTMVESLVFRDNC